MVVINYFKMFEHGETGVLFSDVLFLKVSYYRFSWQTVTRNQIQVFGEVLRSDNLVCCTTNPCTTIFLMVIFEKFDPGLTWKFKNNLRTSQGRSLWGPENCPCRLLCRRFLPQVVFSQHVF